MSYQDIANSFNVGATKNIGTNAYVGFAPMANASNNYSNALQQLQLARIGQQSGMNQASYGLQKRGMNYYLQSLQPGPLDWLSLGITGYGALKQPIDTLFNYGYLPNNKLPIPQPIGE